jgi:hypothetical protein
MRPPTPAQDRIREIALNTRLAEPSGSVPDVSDVSDVSDYAIPEPEPKEIDEQLSVELGHMVDNNVLRGHPSGDERCDNCRYYLEEYKDLSYCWHPKVRILVGGNWWCQWWEEIPPDGS